MATALRQTRPGATRPIARSAYAPRSAPAYRAATHSCGSSAPANPTARATVAPARAIFGPSLRWRSPKARSGDRAPRVTACVSRRRCAVERASKTARNPRPHSAPFDWERLGIEQLQPDDADAGVTPLAPEVAREPAMPLEPALIAPPIEVGVAPAAPPAGPEPAAPLGAPPAPATPELPLTPAAPSEPPAPPELDLPPPPAAPLAPVLPPAFVIPPAPDLPPAPAAPFEPDVPPALVVPPALR